MARKKAKEKKEVKKPKKKLKKNISVTAPVIPVIIPVELEEKVNELSVFVATAEKYNIHRMRHAHHLLGDAKKKLKKLTA